MEGRVETWYLPVSGTVARAFVRDGKVPGTAIERAALLAMMLAAKNGHGRGEVYRLVNDALPVFAGLPDAEGVLQLKAVRKTHSMEFPTIVGVLNEQAITFAPGQHVEAGAWRGADGRFSPAFQALCRQSFMEVTVSFEEDADSDAEETVDADEGWPPAMEKRALVLRGTTDQVRAMRVMTASSTEHYAVTAFAGTGKTHLLFALSGSGQRLTHLAPSKAHQYAFTQRVGQSVPSMLMTALANDMITRRVQGNSIKWVRAPTVRQTTLPPIARLAAAGVTRIGDNAPDAVLALVERSINRWCYRGTDTLEVDDIDGWKTMPQVERAALLTVARRVWEAMFAPLSGKEERPFTIRAFHVFKWLDIHGAVIPPMGTVLVDEAQDLPAPLVSLLRRYTGGCIVMGDPYQRMTGRVAADGSAKTLSMTESVRAGGAAIDLIRGVLALHSRPLTFDQLRGSREHFTRRRFYRPGEALPTTGFRVYGSVWSMLEDALRLKHAGVAFRLLPASESALSRAAQDAIDMRGGSTHTTYYGNREYGSWQDLASHLDAIGYKLVVRLFERDFRNTDLQGLLSAQTAVAHLGVTLGMLEHCKSLEFGVVTMWPCCFSELDGARRTRRQDELVRAVYLAMSRARDELWLPEFALERLAERVRGEEPPDNNG